MIVLLWRPLFPPRSDFLAGELGPTFGDIGCDTCTLFGDTGCDTFTLSIATLARSVRGISFGASMMMSAEASGPVGGEWCASLASTVGGSCGDFIDIPCILSSGNRKWKGEVDSSLDRSMSAVNADKRACARDALPLVLLTYRATSGHSSRLRNSPGFAANSLRLKVIGPNADAIKSSVNGD